MKQQILTTRKFLFIQFEDFHTELVHNNIILTISNEIYLMFLQDWKNTLYFYKIIYCYNYVMAFAIFINKHVYKRN